jgi:lactoylglutathione lyase
MKFAGACVYVDDVPAALDFYRRAFGFETRFFDPQYQYGELDTGEARVAFASHALGEMLMPGGHPHGRPNGMEIAFITPDVPAALARAVAAGAAPLAEPKTMPWGATVAYLRAPEGTLIGLSTPVGG